MRRDKTVAIIQARLGSTRLPLKTLLCLGEYPVIDWIINRVRRSTMIDEIIVALPDTPLDKILLRHLQKSGTSCISGSESDVLGRMLKAANHAAAQTIIRICADNPLIDPDSLDRLITFYRDSMPDYAYNHIPRNNLWPDGLGGEILSARLLRHIAEVAVLPSQREHCLNYIWDNAENFTIRTFDPDESALRRPEIKLDLDSTGDYLRLCSLKPDIKMDAKAIVDAWDKAFPQNSTDKLASP